MTSLISRNSSFALLLALGGTAACSGGDGGKKGGPDAGEVRRDSGPLPRPDGTVATTCGDVSNFADLGVIDGELIATADYLSLDGTIDDGPPPDLFVIELFAGVEPFVEGFTTGSFEITGDQLDYNLCGVCPTIYADFGDTGASMIYLAQSGTVNVTSVDGNFTGSFVPAGGTASYVGFRFDEVNETFVREDSCTVTGGGASWDTAIPAQK